MPNISHFYGITIRMFFNEDFHPGNPHFHAVHAGRKLIRDHEPEVHRRGVAAHGHADGEEVGAPARG